MTEYDFKLITYPNNLLTTKLPEYEFGKDYDPIIIEKTMHELMDVHQGYGISANQINFDRRVITITHNNQKITMFNPVLLTDSVEESLDQEGCLSFPYLYLSIKRPRQIQVKYLTSDRSSCTLDLLDFDAKCFLHELDHINGICFISKVSKLKLDLAIRKMRKYHGRTK